MEILKSIKKVMEIEANAIKELSQNIDASFEDAVKMIYKCKGKFIITGVGKSGHIGKKIAATFASTGTPSFFIHSTEGVHGDLGMIQKNDIVLMISNSGETHELLNMLPSLKKIGANLISLTSNPNSSLAKSCDVSICYTYNKEADHLGLAPTTSSTLALVIGDALAVSLSEMRKFEADDFHLYHPGGNLGQLLSSKL